jgi:methyl-accepting chemotaxis protein
MAATSADQAAGLTEVERSMSRVDDLTRRNAATAQEFAATAQELSAQASRLEDLVRQFTLHESEVPLPAAVATPYTFTPARRLQNIA